MLKLLNVTSPTLQLSTQCTPWLHLCWAESTTDADSQFQDPHISDGHLTNRCGDDCNREVMLEDKYFELSAEGWHYWKKVFFCADTRSDAQIFLTGFSSPMHYSTLANVRLSIRYPDVTEQISGEGSSTSAALREAETPSDSGWAAVDNVSHTHNDHVHVANRFR